MLFLTERPEVFEARCLDAEEAVSEVVDIEGTQSRAEEDVPCTVDFRWRSGCDGQAVRTIAASLVGARAASE